ncbi:type II toxin-antitoxin system Phd/YefM family antitoxin [Eubacteriales bacterium OttesenSCG-928-A19]|nr:type II toxin-antitoxin system Phd/YefM family antitoxin [Eubacteriales bacterium OttesenSCG-928-A19]
MENKKPTDRTAKRVSSTEFKTNYGKYVKQIQETEQPIDITKNGKVILTVSPPKKLDKMVVLESLVGIAADNPVSLEEARAERLKRQ